MKTTTKCIFVAKNKFLASDHCLLLSISTFYIYRNFIVVAFGGEVDNSVIY